jgi:hypothetical protein
VLLHWMVLALLTQVASTGTRVEMEFMPESPKFEAAAATYTDIWHKEGPRMVEVMEKVSGIRFAERRVRAIVYEGVSYSGFGDRPMHLRASYPDEVKRATVVHELGHRLLSGIRTRDDIDEHRKLFLVLYDVWVALYGPDFADRMVLVERGRKGLYDYDSAWTWALALSPEQRAARFGGLRGRR